MDDRLWYDHWASRARETWAHMRSMEFDPASLPMRRLETRSRNALAWMENRDFTYFQWGDTFFLDLFPPREAAWLFLPHLISLGCLIRCFFRNGPVEEGTRGYADGNAMWHGFLDFAGWETAFRPMLEEQPAEALALGAEFMGFLIIRCDYLSSNENDAERGILLAFRGELERAAWGKIRTNRERDD